MLVGSKGERHPALPQVEGKNISEASQAMEPSSRLVQSS